MMTACKSVLALLSIVLIAGCAAKIKVFSDYNESFDF